VFRQITSNSFQTCRLRIALCISCLIEVKKCFGKGFGWICALHRWSVKERAQTSFLSYSLSGIALSGIRTVQAHSCLNSEQIDTLFISVGGQEGVFRGGGGYFRSEAQNLHVTVMIFFFTLLVPAKYKTQHTSTNTPLT